MPLFSYPDADMQRHELDIARQNLELARTEAAMDAIQVDPLNYPAAATASLASVQTQLYDLQRNVQAMRVGGGGPRFRGQRSSPYGVRPLGSRNYSSVPLQGAVVPSSLFTGSIDTTTGNIVAKCGQSFTWQDIWFRSTDDVKTTFADLVALNIALSMLRLSSRIHDKSKMKLMLQQKKELETKCQALRQRDHDGLLFFDMDYFRVCYDGYGDPGEVVDAVLFCSGFARR
jgi:regulator of replication initiation timing